MEEKEQLEIRCDELETLFETTKHELDVTREALARFHESQQESTRTGIEHEESLLKESAMRERYEIFQKKPIRLYHKSFISSMLQFFEYSSGQYGDRLETIQSRGTTFTY